MNWSQCLEQSCIACRDIPRCTFAAHFANRELSTATDQVSVGARFGSSGNPGRPARLLSERSAIYLQSRHILLGYVPDRVAPCDSACRPPTFLLFPKHQAVTLTIVQIRLLNIYEQYCTCANRGSAAEVFSSPIFLTLAPDRTKASSMGLFECLMLGDSGKHVLSLSFSGFDQAV